MASRPAVTWGNSDSLNTRTEGSLRRATLYNHAPAVEGVFQGFEYALLIVGVVVASEMLALGFEDQHVRLPR